MNKIEKMENDILKITEQIRVLEIRKATTLKKIGEEKRKKLDNVMSEKGMTLEDVIKMISQNNIKNKSDV